MRELNGARLCMSIISQLPKSVTVCSTSSSCIGKQLEEVFNNNRGAQCLLNMSGLVLRKMAFGLFSMVDPSPRYMDYHFRASQIHLFTG